MSDHEIKEVMTTESLKVWECNIALWKSAGVCNLFITVVGADREAC
jgi:hypothetical protein